MILYNYDLDDDCYRVRLAAACLGVPLTLEPVNMYPSGEERSPAMLALNPVGRLPVLVDGDLTLAQVGAILLHLGETAGGKLIPAGPAWIRMMAWLEFSARDLGVAAAARRTSMMGAPGDVDALRKAARDALRIMDDHMTRQGVIGEGYFAGADLSLADLALFPAFALSRDFNVDHDEFPALRLWARRVRRTPGFITMPGIPDYH